MKSPIEHRLDGIEGAAEEVQHWASMVLLQVKEIRKLLEESHA